MRTFNSLPFAGRDFSASKSADNPRYFRYWAEKGRVNNSNLREINTCRCKDAVTLAL